MERKESTGFDWGRAAAMIFVLAAAAGMLWIAARFLLPALLPFLIALLLAAAVRPLAERLTAHNRLSRRAVSVLLVFLLLGLLTLALSFAIRRLITELGELARGLNDPAGRLSGMIAGLSSLGDRAGARIAAILSRGQDTRAAELTIAIDEWLSSLFSNLLSRLASGLPGVISSIVGALPRLLLGLAVTVISAFYFALDGANIGKKLTAWLPERMAAQLPHIKKGAARTAANYLRAYSLILLLTFAELFFGFSVIGVEYSFVIALAASVVDILPVLGVGTILLPWAAVSFALSDPRRGIGLLVLYAVVTIVRQFAEPRIVGGTFGIHPLGTLLAMYLGFRLFGFAGMLLGPVAVAGGRALLPQLLPLLRRQEAPPPDAGA